jgi:hypothetical protein
MNVNRCPASCIRNRSAYRKFGAVLCLRLDPSVLKDKTLARKQRNQDCFPYKYDGLEVKRGRKTVSKRLPHREGKGSQSES